MKLPKSNWVEFGLIKFGLVWILVGLGMFLQSCVSTSYELSKVPDFDKASADEKWKLVTHLNEERISLLKFLSVLEFTDEEKKELDRQNDIFLYHRTVMELHIFHGSYEAADASAILAYKALESIAEIILSKVPKRTI